MTWRDWIGLFADPRWVICLWKGHVPVKVAREAELYTSCLRCFRRSRGIAIEARPLRSSEGSPEERHDANDNGGCCEGGGAREG